MPSPIAHITAGYVVYAVFKSRPSLNSLKPVGPVPGLLSLTTAFSLLPDIDSVAGIIARDFGRFHNNGTHSLIIGTLAAMGFSGLARSRLKGRFRDWFVVSFLCYALHVLMDAATVGRGVMVWWPMSTDRWLTPAALFYGLHWSEGWFSRRHLWTLISELMFAVPLILLARQVWPRRTERQSH